MGAARLGGIVVGAAPVAAGLLLASLLLRAMFGPAPLAIAQAELVEPDARFDIAARTEEALATVGRGTASSPGTTLTVVIGLSTAREGLAPPIFDAASPPGHHLLNLAHGGGSFEDMLAYYGPVIRRLPRGTPLLLAVHPSWLVGRPVRQAPPALADLLHAGAGFTPESLPAALSTWLKANAWLGANRQGMHYLLRGGVLGLREPWLTAAGIAPAARRIAAPGGAFDVRHVYQADRADDTWLQAQLAYWTSAGWFDAARYRADGAQARAWLQLLHDAVTAGTCPSIVLMPEPATLRDRVPALAPALLLQLQAQAMPRARVLDLRSSLPEDRFHDHAHLNQRGRAELSAALPALLAAAPGGCPDTHGR